MRSVLVGAWLLIVACGGSQKASFDGRVFTRGPVSFEVAELPAGWKQVDIDDASLAFRDEEHAASILVNARCLGADDRTPLAALRNHLLMGATERKFDVEETIPFDGREALHTTIRAKWDGVPMIMDTYVLSKDGCVYDFVYTERDGGPPSGEIRTFQTWVKSFRTRRGSGAV